MQELTPEEVKQIELRILLEFSRFCENNRLTYLLAFGTALGAARHSGFIPWDDDIDVVMPREDYERFMSIYPVSKSGRYRLTSYRDQSSVYHFAKLVDTATLVYETYLNPKYSTGLWIDIFPIDRAPLDVNLSRTIAKVRRLFRLREIAVGNPNVGATNATIVAKRLLTPVANVLDPYKLSNKMDSTLASLNKTAPDNRDNLGWVCLDNPKAYIGTFPDSVLFPTKTISFEGHQLSAPCNLDAMLTMCYGDWHALPPRGRAYASFR